MGVVIVVFVAILLPTVDPVSLAFEVIAAPDPLFALDLAGDGDGAALGAGWRALAHGRGVILSADWVLPVDGATDRARRGRIVADGRIAAVGTQDELGRASTSRAPRSSRASSTRTRTSSTRCTRASATAAPSSRGSRRTSSASAGSACPRWRRSRGSAPRSASPPGSRPSPTRASAARRRPPAPTSACARSSTSRSSGELDGHRRALRADSASGSPARCPTASGSGSPRTRRRPSRSSSTPPPTPSGCRSRPTWRRARPNASGSSTARATTRRSRSGSRRPPARPASGCSPRPACSTTVSSPRTASHVDDEEIELLGGAPAPGRPLPALERLPRLRHRAAARAARRGHPASGSAPTAPRRRRPSTCSTSCARASPARGRARSRPEALGAAEALELATLGSARALRLDDEIGSLTPGKQADLTVVSLAGTPFVPWEDPAAAVVLGGKPGRVVATLVAGETAIPERRDAMARVDRRRAQRTRAAAPAARRQQHVQAIEDTMFFPRLRRHAKWMFVLLALIFGLGFVLFGVGAGGTGIGELLRGGGGGGGDSPSVYDARKRVEENPNDATGPARPGDGAPARRPDGRVDRRAPALHRAPPLGQRTRSASSPASTSPRRTRRSCARSSAQIQAASATGALFAQPLQDAKDQPIGSDPITPGRARTRRTRSSTTR